MRDRSDVPAAGAEGGQGRRGAGGEDAGAAELVVLGRRPVKQTLLSGLVLLLGTAAARSIWNNPNFEWPVVGEYLFSAVILGGLATTCALTVVTMALSVLVGSIVAAMQASRAPVLVGLARLYIFIFRGTPQLVQLLFWYNLAALYPRYTLGIPFFAPHWLHGSVNDLITPASAAILGLGLNEGAYMTEIIRAGLASVDPGQAEAARSIGMRPAQVMRRIIAPQALRLIVPPFGNQVIGMLKTTSLVSVIALTDILYAAQNVYSRTYQTIPLLIVASLWYLVVTSLLSGLQHLIERRLDPRRRTAPGRGAARARRQRPARRPAPPAARPAEAPVAEYH